MTPLLSSSDGIGIVDFLEGNNFLVTGATGFLAKVLIEKMLRTVPNVGNIFVMIKGKDRETVQRRLKNEVIDEELFRCLREIHGKSYEAFMMSKLVPVVGNVCENNLGMDADTASLISQEVHVIVNSAANTNFDERYDVAINTNTKGAVRILDFATTCNNLKLFLHVSTAFVNGKREGIILEKAFCLGESTTQVLDVSAEMKLAFEMSKSVGVGDQKMKDLGMERARIYGWENTYVFTKAMGEMLISSNILCKRDDLVGRVPVVIVRPSIIESSYRSDPFPGWIQGYRVLEPLFISYGKGQLPGLLANPKTIMDIVPVDMVVNAMLTVMAKHGSGTISQAKVHVYNVTSSVSNPISLGDIFGFAYDYFTCFPLLNSKAEKIRINKIKYFSSIESFSSYITHHYQTECNNRVKRFLHLAKLYEPYLFYQGRFDDSNTKKLIRDMSAEEKNMFCFDVESIKWEHYIKSIHLPGLRRHVIKEKPVPTARL